MSVLLVRITISAIRSYRVSNDSSNKHTLITRVVTLCRSKSIVSKLFSRITTVYYRKNLYFIMAASSSSMF